MNVISNKCHIEVSMIMSSLFSGLFNTYHLLILSQTHLPLHSPSSLFFFFLLPSPPLPLSPPPPSLPPPPPFLPPLSFSFLLSIIAVA